MFEDLALPFVQRGLLEVAALSIGAGLIGTFIVMRGLSFYAHAVGTAAFPGLVLADGLGFAPALGAFGTAILVAALVAWLARREREREDAITALVLVAALSLGVVLASDVFHSAARVDTLLFGSLLTIDGRDIAFAAAVSVVVLGASAVLGPRWLATGFEGGPARGRADAALLGLVALVAVAALAAVGALLATAMLVVPAATTRLFVTRVRPWQVATILLVLAEGAVGMWLALQWNAPPGATIAVLAGVLFALAALVRIASRAGGGRRPARAAALAAALAGLVGLSGCGSAAVPAGTLPVVATTTQVGDLVRQVGGTRVDVRQILRPNTDPHEYEPRPDDVRDTARAKVVFTSGDGLDGWIGDVTKAGGGHAPVVDLGAGVPDRVPGEDSRYDPHWWHDPQNMEAAAGAVAAALSRADPAHARAYAANAAAYVARLRRLDAGIRACLRRVPPADRTLVTDHDAFATFARHYGIRVVGAVIPSQTTLAQPSARDLVALAATIRREGVRAVFPEQAANDALAQAIATRTGAAVGGRLYGDTLGPAGSRGATYLGMEQANADAMVRGFSGGRVGCRIAGL